MLALETHSVGSSSSGNNGRRQKESDQERSCLNHLKRKHSPGGGSLQRSGASLIFLRKRGQGFLLFNQLLGLVKLPSNSSGD
jgi:hypothetical protein